MKEIKVEKDTDCDLEAEIKTKYVEIRVQDSITREINSPIENLSVPSTTKGVYPSIGKDVIDTRDKESENRVDLRLKREDERKLQYEINFEETLSITKNLRNFNESAKENENENESELMSEIKVEEVKIQASDFLVKRKAQEITCVVCMIKITPLSKLCVLCFKPLCLKCIQNSQKQSQNQGLPTGNFIICSNCNNRNCFVVCEKVQHRIKEEEEDQSNEGSKENLVMNMKPDYCRSLMIQKPATKKVKTAPKRTVKNSPRNHHSFTLTIRSKACVKCKNKITFISKRKDDNGTQQAFASTITCVFCKKPLCSECEKQPQEDNKKQGLSRAGLAICADCRNRDCSVFCEKIQDLTEHSARSNSNIKSCSSSQTKKDHSGKKTIPSHSDLEQPANKAAEQRPKATSDNSSNVCICCGKQFIVKKLLRLHFQTHRNDEIKCQVCLKTFQSLRSLQRHYNLYHAKMRFECAHCGKKYHLKSSLQSHVVGHTKPVFCCKVCDKEFKSKYSCDNHMKFHNINCKICSKSFRDMSLLKYHMKQYHEEKRFECSHCGSKFATKGFLLTHIGMHRTEREYACNLCPSRFKTPKGLKSHEKGVHCDNTEKLECPTCLKLFKSTTILKNHIRIFHSETNSYKCTSCLKTFNQRYKLTAHVKMHNMEAKNECFHCGKCFRGEVQLSTHIRQYHSGYKYFCATCAIFLKTKYQLSDHKKTKGHKDKRSKLLKSGIKINKKNQLLLAPKVPSNNYKCHICEKSYVLKHSLVYHLEKHAKKTFQCQICSKICQSRHELIYHRMKNHEKKRFECAHCSKQFIMKSRLIDHIDVHSTKPKFSCNICSKRFQLRKYLKIHMYVHTEAQFHCSVCSKTFKFNISLKNHMKRFHDPLNKTYGCTICPRAYAYKDELKFKKHMKLHENNRFKKRTPKVITKP